MKGLLMLVDDKSAVMDRKEFEALPAYNISLPTGPRLGFRWKRMYPYVRDDMPHKWLLGETVDDGKPDGWLVVWREILIA